MSTQWQPKDDVFFMRVMGSDGEPVEPGYYGDREEKPWGNPAHWRQFYVPSWLSGSDYSGGSATKSNYRVFLAEFGECDGVHSLSGEYGTYAVAIRLDAITDEMREVFEGLDEYPLISDDDHSQLEIELQDEAWENWARRDFQRDLARLFEHLEDQIDELGDTALFALFREGMERSNEWWTEDGTEQWIHLDRIAEVLTAQDVEAQIREESSPIEGVAS